ncbi:hypothetical protein GCM10012319_30850 [Comamonas sp. KCTC 72670]|nr:hypothetical protein GCM10012319_30850 [Comamonas sp. KCTC 72670]
MFEQADAKTRGLGLRHREQGGDVVAPDARAQNQLKRKTGRHRTRTKPTDGGEWHGASKHLGAAGIAFHGLLAP